MKDIILIILIVMMIFVVSCTNGSTGKITVKNCDSDDDCARSEICNDQYKCVKQTDRLSSGLKCATDADCDSDERCDFSFANYGKCIKK